MRVKFVLPLFILLILIDLSNTAAAQITVGENGKISGLIFGDYYWIASDHNSDLKGENGFWLRRIYFTYDQKISGSFSSRFRLELNSSGDFKSSVKLRPYAKDAYLKWHHNKQQIFVGLSPTPAASFVVGVWGYRAVEKSPLVLQKMVPTRNLGISFKGDVGNRKQWHYFFMVGDGNGGKADVDKGKKLMSSLAYDLTKKITIQGYGSWNDKPGGKDVYTMQGFLAYQTKEVHIGALFAHQTRLKGLPGQRVLDLNMASIFTNFKATQKIRVLLRADHLFEANPVGESIAYIPFSDQAQSTLLIGGTDITLASDVHFIPNIETVVYGKKPVDNHPATDVIPRLTLYYNF